MGSVSNVLSLRVCDELVKVHSKDNDARALLLANYDQMQVNLEPGGINYTIAKDEKSNGLLIATCEGKRLAAKNEGEFLYLFDRELIIQLQKRRRDLYFVHSAVLELDGKACLLVGRSKSGKSTTTLALLHEGFRYSSDELAPVDSKSLYVHPYPRAIWLRRQSPGVQLANCKIQTSWMSCIPTKGFPHGVCEKPTPVGAICFIRHVPEASMPSFRIVGKAEAAARLLFHALNPAVHSENGLAPAIEIVKRTRCFEILTAGLPESCSMIKNALTGTI